MKQKIKESIKNSLQSLCEEVVVVGGSMHPYLREGDKITLEKQDKYYIGDIVVFKYGDHFIIHRIVGKYDQNYLCKGDSSFAIEKVLKECIFGRVVKVIREGCLVSLPIMDRDFFIRSLDINRLYCMSNFNILETMNSKEYLEFYQKYLT